MTLYVSKQTVNNTELKSAVVRFRSAELLIVARSPSGLRLLILYYFPVRG